MHAPRSAPFAGGREDQREVRGTGRTALLVRRLRCSLVATPPPLWSYATAMHANEYMSPIEYAPLLLPVVVMSRVSAVVLVLQQLKAVLK